LSKHTILFLAADPLGTDRLALAREAHAIQTELDRSGSRDSFEFVTRWAAEPLDLLRELRKLRPTVVHFSGHGKSDAVAHAERLSPVEPARHGIYFQGIDGPQLVSTEVVAQVFGAAGSSVKLVVLNACYTDQQAEALLAHIDCIVGMRGSIRDHAARSFAIGFYGGLGERESAASAYRQGCAAIGLEALPDSELPRLKVRAGVDPAQLVLASAAVGFCDPDAGHATSIARAGLPGHPGSGSGAPSGLGGDDGGPGSGGSAHTRTATTHCIFDLTNRDKAAAFYEQVIRSIDAAGGTLYVSGRGFSGDRMEGWPGKVIEAERRALARGCQIVRIHMGTTASVPWMNALAQLMEDYPERLTVYLDRTDSVLVNVRLFDPGMSDGVLQLLVESREREHGRTRDYPLLGISLEKSVDLTRQVRALFEDWLGRSVRRASVAALRASARKPCGDYFAYGSNLSTEQMSRRCPSARTIGPATLTDWALTFDVDAPHLGGAAAGIRRCPGAHVEGVLYALAAEDKAQLDLAEAGGYEPHSVVVRLGKGGAERDAYVYVPLADRAPPPPERWRLPLEYLRTMTRGAREHGLTGLVESLEKLAASHGERQ
jgi:hypothetical protein